MLLNILFLRQVDLLSFKHLVVIWIQFKLVDEGACDLIWLLHWQIAYTVNAKWLEYYSRRHIFTLLLFLLHWTALTDCGRGFHDYRRRRWFIEGLILINSICEYSGCFPLNLQIVFAVSNIRKLSLVCSEDIIQFVPLPLLDFIISRLTLSQLETILMVLMLMHLLNEPIHAKVPHDRKDAKGQEDQDGVLVVVGLLQQRNVHDRDKVTKCQANIIPLAELLRQWLQLAIHRTVANRHRDARDQAAGRD